MSPLIQTYLINYFTECKVWNDNKYCFQLEKKTAADARTFCNSVGSKLFEPKDLAGNEFVTSEAKKRGMTQFWIGIGDDKTEGIFRYYSNDETIIWSNWYTGFMDIQPNNYGDDDCTAIAVTKMTWASGNEKKY